MPVNLEIVSPEKLLLSRPVDMVVIPASEGDMGVLEGHTPMIVMLRGGIIALYEDERVTDQMYIAGGFAEVTPERCTVLANEVLAPTDLSREEGERRLAEAEEALLRSDRFRHSVPARPSHQQVAQVPGRRAACLGCRHGFRRCAVDHGGIGAA
jgi:F-type H+-transporting ATPase subunit epsilon